MKDTRAEIYIKAFDKDGNQADFSAYYYHDKDCANVPIKEFKQYVKDNAQSIAEENCDFLGYDFVAVISVDFETINLD